MALAGEHEPALHLLVLERVVAAHVDLPRGQVSTTGPAHASLAREGKIRPCHLRGIEDRLTLRHRSGRAPPVEYDGHTARLTGDHGLGSVNLRWRLVDVEQLEVHPLARHPELVNHSARIGDQPERAAQPDV